MRLLNQDTPSSGLTGTQFGGEGQEGEMLSVPLSLEKSGSELGPAEAASDFLAYFWGHKSLIPQKGKLRSS